MTNYFFLLLITCSGLFCAQNIPPTYIYTKQIHNIELQKTNDTNFFYLKHIQYIGSSEKSISISYQDFNLSNYNPILKNNYKVPDDSLNREFNKHTYDNIKILVDYQQLTPLIKTETDLSKITEAELISEVDSINEGKKPTREIPEKEIFYEGFPVTIYNLDHKNEKIIGFGNHIPLELEALNSENNWKKIYGLKKYNCGTGIRYIVLKPNEIATIFEPRLSGNFKTKFRYRLGNIISNEFEGSINDNYLNEVKQ